jgi:hypothetical protein
LEPSVSSVPPWWQLQLGDETDKAFRADKTDKLF